MSIRERIMFVIALCVLVPVALFKLVIEPINSTSETNGRKIKDAMEKSISTDLLAGEINYYKASNRPQSSQTDVFLRNLISEMGISQDAQVRNIASSDPDKKFQLTLNNFRNDQLVDILYKIENVIPVIRIEKMSIAKDFRNKDRIKVELNLRSQ